MRQVRVQFWDRSDGGKFTVPGCRITTERDGETRGTGADPLYEHEDPETFRLVACAMQLLEMAARRVNNRRKAAESPMKVTGRPLPPISGDDTPWSDANEVLP